jgi:hypothetical protein
LSLSLKALRLSNFTLKKKIIQLQRRQQKKVVKQGDSGRKNRDWIGLALQKQTNDMRKPGAGKSRQNLLFTYPWGKKCVFLSAANSLTFPYGSLCSALQ